MTPVQLYSCYTDFGVDPWITPPPEGIERFSAWTYAKELAEVMCQTSGLAR